LQSCAVHSTALIPSWFGVALGIFGLLAMSPSESRRKLFMHINVTIGLLGFLGAGIRAVQEFAHAGSTEKPVDPIAVGAQITMTGLLLLYVILCVRSFIAARRSGKV
jgi:hypothetical protein